MRSYRFVFLLWGLLFVSLQAPAQTQQQKALEARRARLQEEMQQINTLLFQQAREKKNVLGEVEDLYRKIGIREELIKVTNQQANLLNHQINANLGEMDKLRNELTRLKEDYAGMIRQSYKNKSQQSRLMFVLSSGNFLQAYKRLQYMKQYSRHRKKQGEKIQSKTKTLQDLNTALIARRKEKEKLIAENRQAKQLLEEEKKQQETLVASIRQREGEYREQIRQKQQEADRIDREIERLIRAAITESNKKSGNTSATAFALTPEARLIADDFSANKGRLIWPVEKGIKSKPFGEYSDPLYPGLKRFNSGVVIATEKGARARAVFKGEVSAVIIIPGGNKAVQLRHGNYITTYYNLSRIYVNKGDKVNAKTPLGEIFTSPSSGKTELKFFLYKNTDRLNPEQWIYRM
ncbi:MAG: peptidoglycan DD-metalloendopeptidase family protein [Sinomicrobium sp.]|nr:peptidoglycan DD-metalloendopeptidase family protein [Sinomicrobium sp.]